MPVASGPTVLVVFGATGDLMSRKIVPAVRYLRGRGLLPERFRVLGLSRRDWDDDEFRAHVRGILEEKEGCLPDDLETAALLDSFCYHKVEFTDDEAYRTLAERLAAIDEVWGVCASKLFYLAVPPESYRVIFERLAASGLTRSCSDRTGWTRVLVEKPFGKDAATARGLDELLGSLFREEQIYRIDHYLAKEMLQGILAFRFSNNLFELGWNAESIASIEIALFETLGVEERSDFYDGVGALRDVGQNHLLQMLALVTMERPVSLGAAAVRARRAELLRSLAPMSAEGVARDTYRAQYEGYRAIAGVAPDSGTETYFKVRLRLGAARWGGVPITIEAGKRMGPVRKEIVVNFRHPHPCLCSGEHHRHNRVVFTLEPDESIRISFWTKRPGVEHELEERTFDFFLYEKEETSQYVEEYAKLLLDAVRGDQTLFVSTEEVRAMWAFIDPVCEAWRAGAVPLASYEPDTDRVAVAADEALEARASAGTIARRVGVVGLGRMGAGIVRNLMEHGWEVAGWNRSPGPVVELESEGMAGAASLADLVAGLDAPRTLWLMVPPGAAVDTLLFGAEGAEGLIALLEPGDTVIDGGNSYFEDAPRRAERLAEAGISFLDCGTSGGPGGARHGACLMIGGRVEDFRPLEPLFSDLALPDGYRHFEGHGAGHFVKMVHNGIEYGMMQAIAEGFAVMHASDFDLDLIRVADVYQHGSVIESRLVGWLEEAFQTHGDAMDGVSGAVGRTGEGEWTLRTAERLGVDARVIRSALEFRRESERDPSYAGRLLTAMRNRFGGHALGGDGPTP
ncbi:MAG: hypothetical protein C0418_02195 [Coriobacteriaceae bacterium]|nr:hypothetical protein [Coriobacteriaceae bacterium]